MQTNEPIFVKMENLSEKIWKSFWLVNAGKDTSLLDGKPSSPC
jgi:hypothetical protein